jgi:hypothetical protein
MDYAKGAPLNTDDNALIELAAPRDLIGFERYKGYLGSVYGASWPYGHIAQRVQGIGQGAEADGHLAGIALALLDHGRRREASAVLDRAGPSERSDAVRVARDVLGLVSGSAAAPPIAWPVQSADPTLLERSNARFSETFKQAAAALPSEPKRAHELMSTLPDNLVRHFGRDAVLLRAVSAFGAGDHSAAITDIETLLRSHPDLPEHRPEAMAYLARAHYVLQHFGKGVSWGKRWVETRPQPGPTMP